MKRNYVAPFAKIHLCIEDVITASGLTQVMGDDNVVSWGSATTKEDFTP
jgi:hypothetical protein